MHSELPHAKFRAKIRYLIDVNGMASKFFYLRAVRPLIMKRLERKINLRILRAAWLGWQQWRVR
jgi:hypothetical protein